MNDPQIDYETFIKGRECTHYLKLEDLKDGHAYLISTGHSDVGIWNAGKLSFLVVRQKANSVFLRYEPHWDFALPLYNGIAKPLVELECSNKAYPFPNQDGRYSAIDPELVQQLIQYLIELTEKYPLQQLSSDFLNAQLATH